MSKSAQTAMLQKVEDIDVEDTNSDDDIPGWTGPATSNAYHRLFPHRNVLLHTHLTGASKILIVCPKEDRQVADTMRGIIQNHRVGSGGSVLIVHHAAATLPTVDMIRRMLDPQHPDDVIVFGYASAQLRLGELKTKLWIDGLVDLVRPLYILGERLGELPVVERVRGGLLLQVAPQPHEYWLDTAKRYSVLMHDMGIRLDAINSLQHSIAFDLRRTIARHRTLARNLARIPNGNHERFIAYLRTLANNLKPSQENMRRNLVEDGDTMVGCFLPDKSASSTPTWWWLTDPEGLEYEIR